jgi:N6-adenosine-specific RNA methylase IME4
MTAPAKQYGVIYADPPWRFEPWSRKTGLGRSADNHYPTMTLDEIKALPIPAAKNCALLLWALGCMKPQALEVMSAWGFEYKAECIWVKKSIGLGFWWRSQHESLLLGTRGKVRAPERAKRWPSVIVAPRGRHSEKPAIFAEMIEQMFPTVPKLEMFARAPREGWDVWGNEVDGDVDPPAARAIII